MKTGKHLVENVNFTHLVFIQLLKKIWKHFIFKLSLCLWPSNWFTECLCKADGVQTECDRPLVGSRGRRTTALCQSRQQRPAGSHHVSGTRRWCPCRRLHLAKFLGNKELGSQQETNIYIHVMFCFQPAEKYQGVRGHLKENFKWFQSESWTFYTVAVQCSHLGVSINTCSQ